MELKLKNNGDLTCSRHCSGVLSLFQILIQHSQVCIVITFLQVNKSSVKQEIVQNLVHKNVRSEVVNTDPYIEFFCLVYITFHFLFSMLVIKVDAFLL